MKPTTMKTLKYKVFTNEHGIPAEFSNKRQAIAFARWQKRCRWSATVVDMRTNQEVQQ